MADTSKIVKQFLGDEKFPVKWESEAEKQLFWVYDDLHCPHPVSPMYFDIGGWWLTCDHMFRRFGTPFAADWIAKNVNGYLFTAAVPADPDCIVDGEEYGNRYGARVPTADPGYAGKIGPYLGNVLPVYGREFDGWWRNRLVPEIKHNFEYLEGKIDNWEQIDILEWATILEDAMDIHDRHWKIHWMLNFAQFSGTTGMAAVVQEVRGEVDSVLLGRLQNSARDRNWDRIEALWKMKEEIKKDKVLAEAFKAEAGATILAALEKTAQGRRFIADRVRPYQREFGWAAVWVHEFNFPTAFEDPSPFLETVKGYIDSDYDYPSHVKALAEDIEKACQELVAGLTGEGLAKIQAANVINRQMAPLTPDHHFYVDQGTNAHLRLVLICIGKKLVQAGLLDDPEDVMFLRYNELRYLIGDPTFAAKPLVAAARAAYKKAEGIKPLDWIGTATESQLQFPYLGLWGFPEKLYIEQADEQSMVQGLAASPGVVEGIAKVVMTIEEFDKVEKGDILVCQMTNPAWVTLFTKIIGLVTDAGGPVSHPGVLSREFGIPAVVGSSVGTTRIKDGDRIRVDGNTGKVEILAKAK
jgi:phosphohistidine swiveling domain-containing protein